MTTAAALTRAHTNAVIYTRISNDAEGRELGIARQEQDCRALADRLGLTVVAVYSENDTGASTRSRKPRPKYDAMLARVRDGGVGTVLAYSNSRLSRRPAEWLALIELAERTEVQVRTVASGTADFTTADGRAVAGTIAMWDGAEAERTSERVRRAFDQRAQQGKPHGKVAYGWTRVDGVDIVDPAQAAIVQESARRILARESSRSIVKDLNARGIPSPRGGAWDGAILRQIMLRERNAGRRIHRRVVVGAGAWEAILDDDTHDRVRALLLDPARVVARGTGPRYLLSGIATCGLCGGVLRSNKSSDGKPLSYVCSVCHRVRRRLDAVDAVVVKTLVERLSQPDGPDLLGGDQEALAAALEHGAALRTRLTIAARQYADGVIDDDQLATISARLRPQIAEAERIAEAARPADPALRALVAGGDVREQWEAATVDVQRAVVRALLVVTVEPAGPGTSFDPAKIRREWVGAAASVATAA